MKPRRKKLVVTIVGILLAVLILNAFFTWGIIFDHNGGFKWSETYIFEDILTDKRSGRIRLGENLPNTLCIPFVFWIYPLESPPYVLLLKIYDEAESLEKIFIELISIEYVDGQKITHNVNWEKKFNSSLIGKYINSRYVRIPVLNQLKNRYRCLHLPFRAQLSQIPVSRTLHVLQQEQGCVLSAGRLFR